MYNDDDESKGMIRDNRSKEAKFEDSTGNVRKYDMDKLSCHASKVPPPLAALGSQLLECLACLFVPPGFL